MSTQVLSQKKYLALLTDIRQIMQQGRDRAAAAAGKELLSTYWEVGRRMHKEKLSEEDATIKELAEELSMDPSTLSRSLKFYQTYPQQPGQDNLKWSHYRLLLPLTNPAERQWYENLAAQEGFSRRRLTESIRDREFLGRSSKKKGAGGPKTLKRPTKPSFVYKGILERVVDGDTIILRIDLGFDVFKKQRIRFAGIDTPPLDQPGGDKATRYVEDQLNKAQLIVVKTNKIDIYGRYVGHIFYSLGKSTVDGTFTSGHYLNQELLERGMAVTM